jgi:hypothetical protein
MFLSPPDGAHGLPVGLDSGRHLAGSRTGGLSWPATTPPSRRNLEPGTGSLSPPGSRALNQGEPATCVRRGLLTRRTRGRSLPHTTTRQSGTRTTEHKATPARRPGSKSHGPDRVSAPSRRRPDSRPPPSCANFNFDQHHPGPHPLAEACRDALGRGDCAVFSGEQRCNSRTSVW